MWIGLANTTWMFAVAWIIGGVVSGYAYQASIYFTLEEMTEKGKGSGFHEAIVGSGMFVGPVLAGWVGSHHSLRAPVFLLRDCAGLIDCRADGVGVDASALHRYGLICTG